MRFLFIKVAIEYSIHEPIEEIYKIVKQKILKWNYCLYTLTPLFNGDNVMDGFLLSLTKMLTTMIIKHMKKKG